ncbi:hypothetical protein B0J13DRAFT_278641 [Dactylonectria estremocensis]|uniref:Uncharacterized protein n=1 Tax=Dactylonectria estremocensis TaxID=1079267 RepID=A0A9P9EY18_9HYPO|nr:hypothetical protein B0J13DRAFT_278641 [Dactylonectria estremocensis]
MEEGPQILPPPTLEPISRPSSASTAASASLTQLPGISSLAAVSAATASPPSRPLSGPPPTMYTGASPAATSGGSGGNLVRCKHAPSLQHYPSPICPKRTFTQSPLNWLATPILCMQGRCEMSDCQGVDYQGLSRCHIHCLIAYH